MVKQRVRAVPLVLVLLLGIGVVPSVAQQTATGTVIGRVVEAASQRPLAGASVTVDGTRVGSLTATDGRFILTGVPAGSQQVRAQMFGFGAQPQGVTVVAGGSVTVDFQLQPQAVQLEGVVAVGYGTQQRRDLTGSVSSVSVEEARTAPTMSVDQVLQGRAAGVHVVQSSAGPGGSVSVRIRGTNSISANSEPLYVIDGVPAFVGSSASSRSLNPLADLSPNDIESMEVLKDASATAIYGSRGANGVVLITTRRGRRGENRVQFESSVGTQSVTRTIPVLNAQQFAIMMNEGQTNIGNPPIYTQEQIASFGAGTDWQGEIFRTAAVQNHSLTISGGDEQTRYLITGGFLDQDGVVANTYFRRYSTRLNLDREVNERFRVGNNFSLSRTSANQLLTDNASGPGSGAILGALEMDPTLPVRDADGNYVRTAAFIATPNPVATALEITDERVSSRLVGNLFAEYDLTDALQLRVSVGGNALFQRTNYYAPSYIQQGFQNRGSGSVSSVQATDLVQENILTYRLPIRGRDQLDVTAGFTAQSNRYESVWAGSRNFGTDITGSNSLGAGAEPFNPSSGVDESVLLSTLARANYNLLGRYLFTLTGRYDGSSKFGADNKWGFFPSAAFAWRLSDESFLRNVQAISDLKLRTSYGFTGNQEIGTYTSLARLSTYNAVVGNTRVIGYAPAGLAPNPALKWESTRQANVGIDLGVLDNRVVLSLDGYDSTTDDLLLTVPMPANTGFNAQLRNVGSLQNRGVEFSLATVNLERSNVSWRSQLNLARNRNKVLDLGGVDRITVAGGGPIGGLFDTQDFSVLQVGQPLGTYYAFPTNGIWQIGDACYFTSAANCVPGEYRYVDTNADGLSTPEDRVIVGKAEPDLFGGFTNNLTVGPFNLDVFLSGSLGNDVLNVSAVRLAGASSGTNQYAWTFDRWTPENPSQTIPRANNGRARRLLDLHVEDGSYIRLQNVTLGYRVPDGIIPRTSGARVYVSGQNLWVSSNYSGYDPEMNSYGGHPIFRGVDVGAYPRARVFNVGVNATF
jgi:TonB-dependent starch-binding outer membrane protein SusC